MHVITDQSYSNLLKQMTSARLSTLLLIAAAILSIHGQNTTVITPTATIGNFSSLANLTSTKSAVPNTQRTTGIPTNTTQKTTAIPGIKNGECYGFEVFVVNNRLNIPYTVTCCITILCGFYLVLFGKIVYSIAFFIWFGLSDIERLI